jgi:hypothetical protein
LFLRSRWGIISDELMSGISFRREACHLSVLREGC